MPLLCCSKHVIEIRANHEAMKKCFEISRAGLAQVLSVTLLILSRGSGEWSDYKSLRREHSALHSIHIHNVDDSYSAA